MRTLAPIVLFLWLQSRSSLKANHARLQKGQRLPPRLPSLRLHPRNRFLAMSSRPGEKFTMPARIAWLLSESKCYEVMTESIKHG
jgi:hypothetical protein